MDKPLIHRALNVLYKSEKQYGFPVGMQRFDNDTVEITFDNHSKVRIFVEEERVIEL